MSVIGVSNFCFFQISVLHVSVYDAAPQARAQEHGALRHHEREREARRRRRTQHRALPAPRRHAAPPLHSYHRQDMILCELQGELVW